MKKKRGAQPGNKNAVGNRGGGAPYGNKNAMKHGIHSKFYDLTLDELTSSDLTPIEVEYLNESGSSLEMRSRLIDIKIIRLQDKITEWEQSKNKDGLIQSSIKRVVKPWENSDYTVTTFVPAWLYIFKAESRVLDLIFEKNRLYHKPF